MSNKINYEFKVDKAGRKYALKVDVATGKKLRVSYKLAQKRARDLVYSRKKRVVVEKIKQTGSGATYSEYKRALPFVEKEIREKREKAGQKPLSKSVMRDRVKRQVIEYRIGTASRLRYAWVYRVVVERFFDENTGEYIVECDTSVFVARAVKRDGDEFIKMCDVCTTMHNEILGLDLCSVDGGACVIYYNKFDKEVIKKFELGKGCGFSFDFKNYDHDVEEHETSGSDGYDWI